MAAPGTIVRDAVRWRMGVEARALVIVTSVMLAFGLAVMYSASAYEAMIANRSSAFFLVRQVAGVVLGVIAFAVAAKLDSEKWRKWAWPVLWIALVLMAATLLPGISARTYGSKRFLFGPGVQPSEFAKLAIVVWAAMLVDKKGEDGLRRLSKGVTPFLVVLGAFVVIAVREPDYSVALHLALLMGVILYAGGARIGHFVFLAFASIPGIWAAAQFEPYVKARIIAFLNPAAAASQDKLYQLTQSLVAAGSGGLLGVGFGQGRQQFGYMSFPYTDFIGSVIAEEWGLVGIAFVTGLFALYGWLGFRIAAQARNKFQQLVAIGLTVNILVTAYVHLGVIIGLLPTTGLTLPFISYGRSNLLVSLMTTGILVNIGSQRERLVGVNATNPMAVPAR
ncbi:MAG TPA: putative peptidoglycan glycosyltransferase FtsW [Gemmatimonadaceae bacterium]|nr:putative peptidoglycan glycosyltransferase FtsW [Gemmatimonadaceae bacterium]